MPTALVGILALTVYGSAYFSEIFRGALQAVARGHWDAARALGLSDAQMLQHVLLPQMLRRFIAPATRQAVVLIKESAVLSTIAVIDLTGPRSSFTARAGARSRCSWRQRCSSGSGRKRRRGPAQRSRRGCSRDWSRPAASGSACGRTKPPRRAARRSRPGSRHGHAGSVARNRAPGSAAPSDRGEQARQVPAKIRPSSPTDWRSIIQTKSWD